MPTSPEFQSIRKLLLEGDYPFIQKILPVGSLFGATAPLVFYWLLTMLGMREMLPLRALGCLIFLALFFLSINSKEQMSFVHKLVLETALAVGIVFSFSILYIYNDYSIYWWFSILCAGIIYGLTTGRLIHAALVYPCITVAAVIGYRQFVSPVDTKVIFSESGAFLVGWFAAIMTSVVKGGMELFILLTVNLRIQKTEAEGLRKLKASAEANLRLERELQQSRKLEAIGKLAAGIAHDFNNMLTVVAGQIYMLRRGLSDPMQVERLATVSMAINRSSDLVQNLLVFARQSTGVIKRVDIHKVCGETVRLMSASIDKRIEVTQDLRATATFVLGDAGLLQNAILNVAINAGQAMPEGGSLRIATRNGEDRRLTDPAPPNETHGTIVISVSDTGVGMDESVKARIFDPLFTTKEVGKGTGMGLANVYGTMRAHNGSVEVESAPGKGSTFHLTLPLSHEPGTAATEDSPPQQSSTLTEKGSPRTAGLVMVVDDEALVLSTVLDMVQSLGYQTITKFGALEAIECYRTKRAEIGAILLDVNMPKLSGSDALQHFWNIDPVAPIIIMSGRPLDAVAREALEAGRVGYLRKPFADRELSRAIRQACSTRPPASS